jgi:hypothetical protein
MVAKTKGLHSTDVIAGKKPRLSALANNPVVTSVISKLVEGIGPKRVDAKGNRAVGEPSQELLERISTITATNVGDSESIFQLLPDIELAKQILVSSILSPNDMISTELNYFVDGNELDGEMTGALVNVIEDYFENTYKIKKLLPMWLKEALFTHGAYPMAILPESSIDHAINSNTRVSQESLTGVVDSNGNMSNLGILGPKTAQPNTVNKGFSLGFESLPALEATDSKVDKEGYVTVTDNPECLKFPILRNKISQDRIADVYAAKSLGLEAFKEERARVSDATLQQTLYKQRAYKHIPVVPILTLDQLSKETVGHPLVMMLPVESVIPVFVPGNPEDHIGYYIMLDQTGNPVNKASTSDYYSDLASNLHQNKEMVSQLIAMTRRSTFGTTNDNESVEVEEIVRNYSDMVEADLIARLKNGVYGEDAQIARPQEVYRIMLARTMARMQTRLLYLPASLMTYVAFDYNNYGIGKSLLENTKIIGSIRAMLLFANTMAAIKNSVGHVSLNLQLDPEDPDPADTVEKVVHEYARTRSRSYPIGSSNPLDIIDYLQSAGIDVAVSGNTAYPETKLDVEDHSTSKTMVDTDLDEQMKKRHISSFGLAPETVDLSMNVDFATSVVASNIQLTKRVMMYQEMVSLFLNDFVYKYSMNSQHLMEKMRTVVTEKRDSLPDTYKDIDMDKLIMSFLQRLQITLPAPDTVKLDNQVAAYQKYSEALDIAIEAYLSTDFLDNTVMGDLSDAVDTTVSAIKAYFKRQWLRNNNMLPELEELIMNSDPDREGFNLLEAHSAHIESLAETLMDFMKNATKRSAGINKDLEDMGAELEEQGEPAADEEQEEEEQPAEEEEPPAEDEEQEEEPPAEEEEEEPAVEEEQEEEEEPPADEDK